jgi:hypothetical protein
VDSNSLLEIEEIKKLKARYWRLMDQRRWDDWATLFCEDATVECIIEGKTAFFWKGKDEIVAGNRESNKGAKSVHHGHAPEIDLTSDTTATGLWSLFDVFLGPNGRVDWYGFYEDEFAKISGAWKIKRVKLSMEPLSGAEHAP